MGRRRGIVLFKVKYRTLNGPVFASNKLQQKVRFQNRIFLLFFVYTFLTSVQFA